MVEKIESIDKENIKIESFSEFKGGTFTKPFVGTHFVVGHVVCAAIIFTFLWQVVKGYEVADYMITLVGGVVGFYIARAPYDLRH